MIALPHADKLRDASLLALRLIIGAIFINAGIAKFALWSASQEGMTPTMIMLMKFLAIVEPLGGAALIAGFLTRWAALGLAIIMVGAAGMLHFMVHAPFFTGQAGPGVDYVVLILAGCVALVAYGAGRWSVERK